MPRTSSKTIAGTSSPPGPGRIPVVDPYADLRIGVPDEVRLAGDVIEWRAHDWRNCETPDLALAEFVQLAHKTEPESFLAYASRFGVLALDEDGVPCAGSGRAPLAQGDWWSPWYREEVDLWRTYARHALAILRLNDALHSAIDKVDVPEELRKVRRVDFLTEDVETMSRRMQRLDPAVVTPVYVLVTAFARCDSLDMQRRALAAHVSRYWVKPSGLAPVVVWQNNQPVLRHAAGVAEHPTYGPAVAVATFTSPSGTIQRIYDPLAGVLALQLVDALCRSSPLASCENPDCLSPFVRDHPRTRYCSPGCKKVMARRSHTDRQRRYRVDKNVKLNALGGTSAAGDLP